LKEDEAPGVQLETDLLVWVYNCLLYGCEDKELQMKRKASAVWQGGLKDGKGVISTDSGVLSNTQYSFGTRFENGTGTNPEELIAAAHAGCFSMALSAQLGNAGITPESISTTSTITLEKQDSGFAVTEAHLEVVARIPGVDAAAFNKAADEAKTGCPISKLLNAKITMNAKLEQATGVK
jgi:osmotically inducible protein OsmC